MTIEEQLELRILTVFKSIKEFSGASGVSYTTIRSILEKRGTGISKASVTNVIKMFECLNLDVESIETGTLEARAETPDMHDIEKKLLSLFEELNEEGQEILLNQADTLVASGKYKKIASDWNMPDAK